MESKLYGLNFAAFQASLRSKAHHKKREDTHARESAICFAIGENGCTYCSDSRWCDDETRASRYRRGHSVNGAGCVTHLRSSSSVSAEHRFSSTPNFRPLFIVYVVVLLPSEGHGDDGECVDE